MKKKILCFTMAAAMLPFSISAANAQDKRIQTVSYNQNQIVTINSKIGIATIIQLEEDERVSGENAALGLGDSEAWKIAVQGRNILFKPTTDSPDTNLILTTNKRTYLFDLKITNSKTPPTYILNFTYPDTDLKNKVATQIKHQEIQNILDSSPASSLVQNNNYWGKGSKEIAPTSIHDNGRFTYFKFNNGRDLPTIYKKNKNGEALVNTHIEGDTIVVHETAQNFVLRAGKNVLLIENRGFNAAGQFNHTGTDSNESIRLIKGD